MAGNTDLKLHLGCGRKLWQGWINIDMVEPADQLCDIKKLPFADNSASEIAAIHVFEHFYTWEIPDVLSEWRRVLKSGGRLTLEMPNLRAVIPLLMKNGPIKPLMFALYGEQEENRPESIHKWCYDEETMKKILIDAGFRDIVFPAPKFHVPARDMRVECFK